MTTWRKLSQGLLYATLILFFATGTSFSQESTIEPSDERLVLSLAEDVSIDLVKIPAGTFLMGSDSEERFRVPDDRENPRREVTITRDFHIGACEITKGQFAAFVESTGYLTQAEWEGWAFAWNGYVWDKVDGASWKNVGVEQTDEHPVLCVSFDDALAFCDWLSETSDRNVLLPTEAQWEYAARAGVETAFVWGDEWEDGEDWGNASDETARQRFKGWRSFPWDDGYLFTSPIGIYQANDFGLHDVCGNAWEWTSDWYDKDYYKTAPSVDPQGPTSGFQRVARGGSCISSPPRCRVAGRMPCDLRGTYCDAFIGFRVVVEEDGARELPPFSIANRTDWPDWRGPRRDGLSRHVPLDLPDTPTFLWTFETTGPGHSGVAASEGRVIFADKSSDEKNDIWRCLESETGKQIWTLEYAAEGRMDYTNSPRATPVIDTGRAYLLGAFGHLHCVDATTGAIVWKRHLLDDFGAERPTWGMTSTPLLIDDRLIVNPGAEDASLVALDSQTGDILWQTPGASSAYASAISANIRGHHQVITYDAESLGGWDLESGERLWTIVPENDGDFNVPTPILLGEKLLVATENNSTRLYGFKGWENYRNFNIVDEPEYRFDDLAPDMITPVVYDGMVFCPHNANLYCLDAKTLELLWEHRDMSYYDFASMIAGNGRVLILTIDGELLLVRADREKYELIARRQIIDEPRTAIWSHPALIEGRLFIRNENSIRCLSLEPSSAE